MDAKCEIHMSMFPDKKEPAYILIVNDKHVLNLEYKSVVNIEQLDGAQTNLIWTKSK